MSRWNHSICDVCWLKLFGDREPVRLIDAKADICCFCAAKHESGIKVRQDPATTICGGRHEDTPFDVLISGGGA